MPKRRRERQQEPRVLRGVGNSCRGSPVPKLRALASKKESPVNSIYSCELLPEEDSHVGSEAPVVKVEASDTTSTTPPAEDEAAPEGDVRNDISRHQDTESNPSIVHRSYQLPRRLCAAFTQPSFIRDLQQSYVVVVLFEAAERKMQVVGEVENVVACLYYLRTLAKLWREPRTRCKAQERQ